MLDDSGENSFECRTLPLQATCMHPTMRFIYLFIFFIFALPTRAGSPQQHMPITVGPFFFFFFFFFFFCLTHPHIVFEEAFRTSMI
jgi:hypothetical protein